MARLRRDVRPGGLRQRMAEERIGRYGPIGNRHPFDDGLMWEVGIRAEVEDLLCGGPMVFWAWELPRDVRGPFHPNDRVILVGDDIVPGERP